MTSNVKRVLRHSLQAKGVAKVFGSPEKSPLDREGKWENRTPDTGLDHRIHPEGPFLQAFWGKKFGRFQGWQRLVQPVHESWPHNSI